MIKKSLQQQRTKKQDGRNWQVVDWKLFLAFVQNLNPAIFTIFD
jgi:hypothetical protein